MPVTFEMPTNTDLQMLESAMKEYHEELTRQGVTVQMMFAEVIDKESGELEHALKLHGLFIAGKTKVTSLEDRARGIQDAKILIDRKSWTEMSPSRRRALIDHELQHLEIVRDGEGIPRFDDLNRPKLRIRPHDWELTGFQEVVERHGEASNEAAQFRYFADAFGQLNLFAPNAVDELRTPAKKEKVNG